MAYRITLSSSLENLHNVFHASQFRKYILDHSHVIQIDDVKVRHNLIVEASPVCVEGREVKQLRGEETALVKVLWGVQAGGSFTWECKDRMRESYPTLFSSGNFQGRKFFKWGRIVTP